MPTAELLEGRASGARRRRGRSLQALLLDHVEHGHADSGRHRRAPVGGEEVPLRAVAIGDLAARDDGAERVSPPPMDFATATMSGTAHWCWTPPEPLAEPAVADLQPRRRIASRRGGGSRHRPRAGTRPAGPLHRRCRSTSRRSCPRGATGCRQRNRITRDGSGAYLAASAPVHSAVRVGGGRRCAPTRGAFRERRGCRRSRVDTHRWRRSSPWYASRIATMSGGPVAAIARRIARSVASEPD